MNNDVIIIEQFYPYKKEKIWNAITNPEEMKLWYFDVPGFKPEPGFKFQFLSGPSEENQYLHVCEITEVDEYFKLAHTWSYDGYEGNTIVSIELKETEEGTNLKLSHSGIESFPKSNPDFAKSNFIEGWKWIIETSLKNYLELTYK